MPRLSGKKSEIVITSGHKVFEGTGYASPAWSITYSMLPHADMDAMMRAREEAEESGLGTVGTNLLYATKYAVIGPITDWDGFQDESGDELECSLEAKIEFYNDPMMREFWGLFAQALNEEKEKLTPKEEAINEGVGELLHTSAGSTDREAEELE